mmetsp:Transcript_29207/g.62105  ORF Transcript_29207/g.62105 Transcript_29207/m.62105 type:complete len:439 (-) Transcript_29207:34-1350(-)
MSESLASKICHGPPPPAELTNNSSSLQLISQGAEARVWLVTLPDPPKSDDAGSSGYTRSIHVGSGINVPQLHNFSQQPSPLTTNNLTLTTTPSKPLKIICKERFPKKYRHPQLDASLTKSRTKGEARSLVRCQRADVPCPNVLAIAHWSNKAETEKESVASGKSGSNVTETSTTSTCLFLECVDGCTVRQYFEQRSANPLDSVNADGDKGEPTTKRPRCDESATTTPTSTTPPSTFQQEERVTTVIDSQTLCVAHTMGTLVAKMHAAGVIHGDLTTSNIMIRNPPGLCSDGDTSNSNTDTSWKPQLVLIDFGLATSTASANKKTNKSTNNKKAKPFKQQHNAEEKAVDLYVLERAFLSTHPESELLVEEVWKGYRSYFDFLDCQNVDAIAEDAEKKDAAASICSSRGGDEGTDGHVAKAVLNRLEQVRMRGRKRECFG